MSALQIWLENHNRRLTQEAIDEALLEYITYVEKQRDELAMALEICANAIELRFGKCYELSVARAALASVKGGL